jgi:hypothetical protein
LTLGRSSSVSWNIGSKLVLNAFSNLKLVAYIFSTMFHHCPFWGLAAFWDPGKNITYAFLHCISEDDRESIPRFKRFLTESAPLIIHPILLPVLIMDLETNSTLADDEHWTTEIMKVERETRQEPNTTKSTHSLDLDLPSIIQRMNAASVFLSLIERESETVLLHLDQAGRMVSDLQSTSPRLGQSSIILIRHIEFLVNSRKNLLFRLQNLQRRSQTQLAFVWSLS